MKTRKITSIIAIAFVLMLTSECKTIPKISKAFWHDHNNPCTPGKFHDTISCEDWKKRFPKEYKAYQERMMKQSN